MNGYDLSRNWFNFCFENPELAKPIHSAIFFFACEHCNRLGGKEKFGFPSQMTMEAIGVRKYQTYGKALNDLVDWGFITMIERSKNQYSANIISISATPKKGIARGKALDKATIKHGSKQGHSTGQSKDSIDKPLTIEPINQEPFTGIITHLNIRTKAKYKPTSRKTKQLINSRLNEGFTLDDFKTVIDKKTLQWLSDPEMSKYLRPETLFGSKFEGYLNEQAATETATATSILKGLNL